MHMQQGIGRAGFTLLALVTFAIGAFGFALTWTAFDAGATTFFQMGLGVAAVALLALFIFAAVGPTAASEARPAPPAKSAPVGEERAPAIDYEFQDYQPAAKAAPEQLVIPPAFQETPAPQAMAPLEAPVAFKEKTASVPATPAAPQAAAAPSTHQAASSGDAAAWPGARGKSTWTRKVEHQNKVASQVEEARRRHDLTQKYTRTTPTLRAILDDGVPPVQPPAPPSPVQDAPVPEKLADRAPGDMNSDFVVPGMSVGQCGQCRTLLLAPEERPLRLKCPECAKVTLLQ